MNEYNPLRMAKLRSDQIMAAAAGQACRLRVSSFYPGHMCAGRDTTVGCHLPVVGKGMSTKVTDMAVAFGCFHCHRIIDGVDRKRLDYIEEKYPAAYAMRLLNGLVETHAALLVFGIILVPDAEVI